MATVLLQCSILADRQAGTERGVWLNLKCVSIAETKLRQVQARDNSKLCLMNLFRIPRSRVVPSSRPLELQGTRNSDKWVIIDLHSVPIFATETFKTH